ncbi:MAG TPA: gamma carbonic anhydrase family protein [Candidatus Methanoperedenaceae archaeon]|nr:gamma carbonic anhydrase family protein [Candidatus Methanoperedenaceae archaeon]
MIRPFKHHTPTISPGAFIADTAVVIGCVSIGELSSVWFNAVIRGDRSRIVIGERTSVQDCSVIHSDREHDVNIGNGVTIGHGCVLHGCTVGDDVLVGMNTTVLNGARIGSGSLVGAGALVTEGTVVPERSLVLGIPGKVVRGLSDDEIEGIKRGADVYVALAGDYR